MLEAIYCLTMALYHEARDQPYAGKIAVAQVIQHRVESNEFPNTTCKVLKQTDPVKQFTFVWAKPKERDAWIDAKNVAIIMLDPDTFIYDLTNNALCYARKELKSPCSRMTNFIEIGDHRFWSDTPPNE